LSDPSGVPEAAKSSEPSPFARLRARWLIVIAVLAGLAAFGIGTLVDPAFRSDARANVSMLVVYLAMLLAIVVRASMAGIQWRKVLGPAPAVRDLPLLGVIIPLGLLTAAALVMLFVPLSYLAPDVVQHTILDETPLDRITSTGQFVLLALVVSVVAPIVEELFFRGLIMQRFAYKWGTSAAVVASSALFALGHVEWIGHFVTGVAFALIYLRTRSLWMSMLAHGSYNAIFLVSMGWAFFTHQPPEVQTLNEFRSSLGVTWTCTGRIRRPPR
jgi:uncharacterized protein